MVFARPTADNSTQVHLFHPHMPLTLNHLRRLRNTLRPSVTHLLPLRVLYCHLLISASSPLIPRDRYLSLTMDNTIHTMPPNDTHDPSTPLHFLHLFLNPSTGFPYLLYTFDGQPNTNPPLCAANYHHNKSTQSFPSSKRHRRQHMMRTTAHNPTLSETISFPADSVQHKMNILTLVIYMLLSAPVFKPPLIFWGPVRQPTAHQQTLGIILATLALKRYHPIWFTYGPPILHTVQSAQSTSAPLTTLILGRSLGIASTCSTPVAYATPHKRKHHSPLLTPDDEDDNGPVHFDDTAAVHDTIDDVAEKRATLLTSHL